MNPVLILAGTREQASTLARWHDMPPLAWLYVDNVRRMLGRRDQVLWLFGTWRDRNDARECIEVARGSGLKIFTIEDERNVGDDWK